MMRQRWVASLAAGVMLAGGIGGGSYFIWGHGGGTPHGSPPAVNTAGAGTFWTPELNSGDACAKDYSNAAFPTADMFGQSRPLGVTADAGPNEVG